MVVGTVGTDHANGKPRNRLVVLHGGLVWAGYDKHFLPMRVVAMTLAALPSRSPTQVSICASAKRVVLMLP